MHKIEVKNHPPILTWMGLESPDEWQTLEQAKKIVLLPWTFHHVALCADGHQGKGSTIGSVVALKGAVSAAMTGGDEGCGVGYIKINNLKAADLNRTDLEELFRRLTTAIPVGFNSRTNMDLKARNSPLWEDFKNLTPAVKDLESKAKLQCGSLGSGNHTLEVTIDLNDDVGILVHSGSRNIGKTLAEYHTKIAKHLDHNQGLPDPDLSVFLEDTPEFIQFIHDLKWAQAYAFLNRETILRNSCEVLKNYFEEKNKLISFESPILCHHNFIEVGIYFGEEVYVTRKGAISAKKGELGIVLGSQTSQSYIVKGLGNEDSFCSIGHGSGRHCPEVQLKRNSQWTI